MSASFAHTRQSTRNLTLCWEVFIGIESSMSLKKNGQGALSDNLVLEFLVDRRP